MLTLVLVPVPVLLLKLMLVLALMLMLRMAAIQQAGMPNASSLAKNASTGAYPSFFALTAFTNSK